MTKFSFQVVKSRTKFRSLPAHAMATAGTFSDTLINLNTFRPAGAIVTLLDDSLPNVLICPLSALIFFVLGNVAPSNLCI